MVKEETFILVSLEEEKSKQLAQIITNETARKILDYLTKKEASESEIAKELNLPLTTIHYNIQQLLKNNLIQCKEFVWSEKGKEINIYTIAKKFIIIAPKYTETLRNQLKKILPVALFGFVATGVIYFFTKNIQPPSFAAKSELATVAEEVSRDLTIQQVNPALWFLYGVIFVVVFYLFWSIVRKEK